jgi:hypothetical protein
MNRPQIASMLIQAWIEVAIWGRRTGKTTGLISKRQLDYWYTFPQGTTAFVSHTYQALLTRTLPSLRIGLAVYGWEWGKDYHIGRFGPKSWKRPYFCPADPAYFIHNKNGSGTILSSQYGNIGNINGATIDAGISDEAKYINKSKFDEEVIPALSGNSLAWKEHPLFGGWLFVSDMPRTPEGYWLFDYEKLMDTEQIELIKELAIKVNDYILKLDSANGVTAKNYLTKLNKYKTLLDELRYESIYYSEASTLENMEVLGERYIRNQQKVLSPNEFDISILNLRGHANKQRFYGEFDPNIHGYYAIDNDFLRSLDYDYEKITNLTCRKDTDIDRDQGLHIALDYGANFNGVCTAQLQDHVFCHLSSMSVTDPHRLRHLAEKWCDYYRDHPTRIAHYYYDHTAVGRDAIRDIAYYQEWSYYLKNKGWDVRLYYIGLAPSHVDRFNFWQKFLRGGNITYPRYRYNRGNNEDFEIAIQSAQTKEGRKGIEKDKTSEKPERGINQAYATHITDALDTLAYSMVVIKPLPLSNNSDIGVISM